MTSPLSLQSPMALLSRMSSLDSSGLRAVKASFLVFIAVQDVSLSAATYRWKFPPRPMMGIDSCGILISAVHNENGEEKLHLLMVDPHIPAGAKLY